MSEPGFCPHYMRWSNTFPFSIMETNMEVKAVCACMCVWVRTRVCVHACINCHTLLMTIQHIQSSAQSYTPVFLVFKPQSYTHSLAACLLPHHACVFFRLVLDPKCGKISNANAQTSRAAESLLNQPGDIKLTLRANK